MNCFTKLCWFLPYTNMNESWFIHMSPLSWIYLPHPTPQGCHIAPDLSSLHYTASLLWLILHVVIYMFQCYSQFLPFFPSPTMSTSLFSKSVSPLLHWQVFWEPGYTLAGPLSTSLLNGNFKEDKGTIYTL